MNQQIRRELSKRAHRRKLIEDIVNTAIYTAVLCAAIFGTMELCGYFCHLLGV